MQKYAAWLRWILLIVVTPIFAGITKAGSPPDWFPGAWTPLFPWVVANGFWVLPGPPVAAALLKWLESRIERKVRRRRLETLLERILERLRRPFIPDKLRGEPPPNHRLTIFAANLQKRRLDIIARSSEATRGSKTWWSIDPDDQNKCEGVAGTGWYLDSTLTVPNQGEEDLPDVSGDCSQSDIEDYAKRAFVTKRQVRRHKWSARSFAALTIRVDGRRWGVLVLDSTDPEGASKTIIQRNLFAADMLGDIIKEWGAS